MSSLQLSGKGGNMRIGKTARIAASIAGTIWRRRESAWRSVDAAQRVREKLGQLVDISAGGVRIRTNDEKFQTDNQVRICVSSFRFTQASARLWTRKRISRSPSGSGRDG